VHDVKSVAATASSTFSYSFTTPDPTVYFLVPGTGSSGDRIQSARLSGGKEATVYSAPHIRRFVSFPDALVVNTVNADGTDALTVVSLSGAAPIPIQVAAEGTITSLKSLTGSKLFGYTFTAAPSPYYETPPDLLFAYDLTRGQDFTIPITGPDQEQFTAKNWLFVPGTTSLVAQTMDSSLLLVDAIGERDATSGPIPLGRVDSLDGFAPGTRKLLTTTDGTMSATDLASPDRPTVPAGQDSTDGLAQAAGTVLAGADLGPTTTLCESPNAKYGAVTTSAADGSSRITYFSIADAKALSTVDGTQSDWCGS
jgi:hypothetical protein